MRQMDYFNSLPEEITVDIFKRLSVDTVLECKLVSKTWKNLIHNPRFSAIHLSCLFESTKNTQREFCIRMEELKAVWEEKVEKWNEIEESFQHFMDIHSQVVQGITQSYKCIQQFVNVMNHYNQDTSELGVSLRERVYQAEKDCRIVVVESRKWFKHNCWLHNEYVESKGNVRVYGRVQPCGADKKRTVIQFTGKDGELVIADPSVRKTDGRRLFKFNKVYGQQATEEEVFLDAQPVIRSVIDGYNVCIFTYGQSGWEKTNRKTGLDAQDRGVHFEALNVLFQMTRNRRSAISYKIEVQMVEIYNEQVRDLLRIGVSHKKPGSSQPNGLTVPDASMHPVESVSDVLKFIRIGLAKQARGLTALNERVIRSHSILTVHVHGTDLVTEATLRGSLHLVDLARSGGVTRRRGQEAKHISNSLSALGDVMFALSQNDDVPYTNSQLTRVLQSSLASFEAKTVMFVQLNPDVDAYSESLSTLKFAERFSGVELGSAED